MLISLWIPEYHTHMCAFSNLLEAQKMSRMSLYAVVLHFPLTAIKSPDIVSACPVLKSPHHDDVIVELKCPAPQAN